MQVLEEAGHSEIVSGGRDKLLPQEASQCGAGTLGDGDGGVRASPGRRRTPLSKTLVRSGGDIHREIS
jgi:hypothetical protein